MNKKEANGNLPHFNLFPTNRRGQGLSTGAIILIILGVIVLVVLAIGFLAGFDTIAPWIKKTNNVDTIAQACSLACSTGGTYSFCSEPRELKAKDLPGEVKSITNNCKFFATEPDYSKYFIKECPTITC